MDLGLGGKVAFVSGSSRGIGESIAMTLAREGATIVVHGRDRSRADAVAATIKSRGGTAHAVVGDLTDDGQVERMVSEAQDRAGPIGILVNNAGGSGTKRDWTETDADGWADTYAANVLAAVRLATRFLPAMRRAGWGRVINISSGAATMPPPTGPDYAAAKAGINAMTASLAKAVAADGVTVNAVSPGTVRSERLENTFRSLASQRGIAAEDAPWDEIQKAVLPLVAAVPMGRVGEIADVAEAVAFLASPLAGYVTGINMRVDGGMASQV